MLLTDPIDLPPLPTLKLAVVGHVEWVTFLRVDHLAQPGLVTHAQWSFDEPAGAGAVIAVKLARLTQQPVHFFTALGKDALGEQSFNRLEQLGLKLEVSWKDHPTRRGISMVDSAGERAITVIGNRLQPEASDILPWEQLSSFHAVFVTATDAPALRLCRRAANLLATPRLSLRTLQLAAVELDALIGSALDPDEQIAMDSIYPVPKVQISTEGSMGGQAFPGGRYKAFSLKSPAVDSYGCGDSFAAGFTVGLAAGWSIAQAVSLGAECGAKCASYYGPYS